MPTQISAPIEATQALWTPQRGPQFSFFESEAFELLYGGAAGGGKSDALIADAFSQVNIPGYRAILFRRTFPEIEKSLVPRCFTFFSGLAKAKNRGTEWVFPNGATVYLSHLEREWDKEKHKSAEYDFIGFDELTSFSETQYTYLFSRCRGKNPDIFRHIRSASNPSGTGLQWVKKRFVEPDLDKLKIAWRQNTEYAMGWRVNNRVYTDFSSLPDNFETGEPEYVKETIPVYKDASGLTRQFIPALMWANPNLLKNDPDYVKRLQALPEKEQRALLYGHWDVFEGQFFPNFDKLRNTEPAHDIPPHWRRFVAIDYGYTAPFAAIWAALEPNTNRLHVYREAYQTKTTTEDQAKLILELSRDERIEWYAGDPSMFNKNGIAESHGDIYRRHGIPLLASSNNRPAGWALMRQMVDNGDLVISTSCTNLLRTIPEMQHAKNRPEDIDTTLEDHALDALRYLILTLRGWKTRDDSGSMLQLAQPPSWWTGVKKNQTTILA